MNISPVDTLRLTARLQRSGLDRTQAESVSRALYAETCFNTENLATKTDVDALAAMLNDPASLIERQVRHLESQLLSNRRAAREESAGWRMVWARVVTYGWVLGTLSLAVAAMGMISFLRGSSI